MGRAETPGLPRCSRRSCSWPLLRSLWLPAAARCGQTLAARGTASKSQSARVGSSVCTSETLGQMDGQGHCYGGRSATRVQGLAPFPHDRFSHSQRATPRRLRFRRCCFAAAAAAAAAASVIAKQQNLLCLAWLMWLLPLRPWVWRWLPLQLCLVRGVGFPGPLSVT